MRLIDADWLLEHRYKELVSYDTYDLEEILECVPTVEQKRGHWQGVSPMVDSVECSCCGYQLISEELETPYCAWCGAKMDEVVTE